MSLDLAQFHAAFFEESFEALDGMEAALLALDVGAPDIDRINTIFRVAHSIKGGSGMFNFNEVTSFTHSLETLLDELRSGRKQVTTPIADLLFKSIDVMREMLRARQGGRAGNEQGIADLQFDIEQAIAAGPSAAPAAAASPAPAPAPEAVSSDSSVPAPALAVPDITAMPAAGAAADESTVAAARLDGGWHLDFRPHREFFARGNDPMQLIRELASLGRLVVEIDSSQVPPLGQIVAEHCYFNWTMQLHGDISREALGEVFDWADGDCDLEIRPLPGTVQAAAVEMIPEPAIESEPIVAIAPTPPPEELPPEAPLPAAAPIAAHVKVEAPAAGPAVSAAHPPSTPAPAAGSHDSGSIRVSIEKIDELMNTVGELVINQAMLTELAKDPAACGSEKFQASLAQLERNMRELQASVMRVRMLPISVVFSRFPRMVRDLAQRLGKQIDLKVTGDQTELDKTVMEKIGDPLTHLVRNSIDHGVEGTEARVAAGKSPAGTVHLHAYHRGGNIAIEVSDDGAGLDKERILSKARARGLVGPDDVLSDTQICDLIFAPGLSTAEKTTDLSGRGVGMDVVRRNVQELGGNVEIKSERGRGSCFTITLPLTLAIVDGQSVSVGGETYIVPLVSIVESLQLEAGAARRLSSQSEVFGFRGDYLPIVRLHEVFGIPAAARELHEGLIVVAEGEGRRVGLFVDELLGQQQVVIKSLRTNYGNVDGISGATILGDGSVALILDLPGIIRASYHSQAA